MPGLITGFLPDNITFSMQRSAPNSFYCKLGSSKHSCPHVLRAKANDSHNLLLVTTITIASWWRRIGIFGIFASSPASSVSSPLSSLPLLRWEKSSSWLRGILRGGCDAIRGYGRCEINSVNSVNDNKMEGHQLSPPFGHGKTMNVLPWMFFHWATWIFLLLTGSGENQNVHGLMTW